MKSQSRHQINFQNFSFRAQFGPPPKAGGSAGSVVRAAAQGGSTRCTPARDSLQSSLGQRNPIAGYLSGEQAGWSCQQGGQERRGERARFREGGHGGERERGREETRESGREGDNCETRRGRVSRRGNLSGKHGEHFERY